MLYGWKNGRVRIPEVQAKNVCLIGSDKYRVRRFIRRQDTTYN